ncbi:hypothetical protein B0J13DRAFT_76856 [Dactylonectria estremocensis]|uniref:DUF1765-domain-containing protein n=1 Tax=Dactylonectria estremocensis TaxID=1079267 RepID=A0A9P9EHQ3_9HYPO|nr:hypothetical protein B0J13DRAFT_76856 [Dactylonectria estremocensis]
MGASTMIMAPAAEPSTSYPRSHSSSDLLALPGLDRPAPTFSLSPSQRPLGQTLSSLPSLPDFDVPSFNSDFSLDTSVFLAGNKASPNLPAPIVRTQEVPDETSRTNTKLKSKTKPARTRTGSLAERPRWLPNSLANGDAQDETPPRPTTSAADMSFGSGSPGKYDSKPQEKSPSTTSFASFAKRSWRSSRSPSPMENPDAAMENATSRERSGSIASTKLAKTRKRPGLTVEQAEKNQSTDSLKPASKSFRASSYFSKKKQKPTVLSKLNTNTIVSSDNSCASSATSLAPPPSTSTEGHTSQSTPIENNAPTDESLTEMSQPQTRDTLWSTFKTLDVEFKGFLARTTAQRMALVQSLVFPFLRNTLNHQSIERLYPEDVDRRATILNKWWTAMLEMLEGQSPQPLPGVDRQILYEAVTLMMMRPEWRQTTSYFQPLASRSPDERVRTRSLTSSGSSMTSSQAAFLEESSEHNVRTMFVTNLIRQMAFVVEKLSLRNAPPTLVNFAGKACAYAFFFAPGVADILIRLWGLSPELIRRVADEFGLPRRNKGESEDIVALFPPNLSMFGWTTPKGMWDNLKQVPKLPMLVSRIPWTGPWVTRWKGRDTDLFFVFCKYFHILSEQFMPPGLPLVEKARSPAFALIHGQLLFNMDNTIHRQTSIDGAYGPALMDSMNGADAALTLPLAGNVMKAMSENKLVLLLKDFLSDGSSEIAEARHTFAETFASLMKASTRKTSQFNHTACFTLCDFLEEVLVLYSKFEAPDSTKSFIDWSFWFDVCKRIMGTFNTMSEVRMISLIFAIWDAIAKDPQRKLALCHDWLLSEETFNDFFNHWCPMVRAYYQRLIAWRMCRDNGKQDDVDAQIFKLVAKRLRTNWAHYLYLKHTAELEQRPPPSTAPVLPAPGKRFMIIRQEVNTPQPGLFMGSDSGKPSSPDVIATLGVSDEPLTKNDSKKRWSLLGKVLSLSGAGNSNSEAGLEDELQAARRDTAEGRSSFSMAPSKNPAFNAPKTRSSDDDLPIYEEPKFVFKFILAWQNQTAPFRDRFLTRPRLPTPAQSRLQSSTGSASPQTPSGGFSPPRRQFSGSPQIGGLINGAKNASPLSSPVDEKPRRLSLSLISTGNSEISLPDLDDEAAISAARKGSPAPSTGITNWNADRFEDGVTSPVRPTGIYTKNVVYAGRSLAEWSQVVFECNNFVERRTDEGVVDIGDMETPILGVDGFRKLGV